MSVTIKDIAREAHVTIGTVSLALRGDVRISEPTRHRITRLADELGYVPSNIGRALQSGNSMILGHLIANVSDSFYPDILDGIGQAATQHGYSLMLGITGGHADQEKKHLRLFMEKSVDGIIVSNYQQETVVELERIHASGVPVVTCDYKSFNRDVPNVQLDDVKASRMAVEHLYGLGHQRIAFCFCANEHAFVRYQASCDAAEGVGLTAPVLCKTMQEFERLLAGPSAPTAVIGYSDHHAIAVKQAAERAGYAVPRAMSVVGFDDIPSAAWPEIHLTTIRQPKTAIGIHAVNLLYDLIGGGKNVPSIVIEPELVVRGSTSAPRTP